LKQNFGSVIFKTLEEDDVKMMLNATVIQTNENVMGLVCCVGESALFYMG